MKKLFLLSHLMGGLALLISACGSGSSGDSQATTPAAEAVFTSAAQTAEALRVERFAQTATLPVQSLIETSAFATATPTLSTTKTQVLPTAATPAATLPSTGSDRGEFVADVNIPDGTVFAPNQAFQKTWRISNAGAATWTSDYALVYIDGALMGAQPSTQLEESVAPGEQVDITIDMVAPPDPGSYRGYWKMRNANGQIFGFGANADEAIWVDIVVQEGSASVPQTASSEPGGAISTVKLSVDQAQVSGSCPHTFIFTAQITLIKPSTLTYALEAGSLAGTGIRLPQPVTQNLGSGTHPVVYELSVPLDVEAWARLHITQPVEAFSNQIDFSLICG